MSATTGVYAPVKIDAQLADAGWNLTDGVSVLFEQALPDGTHANHVLCDRSRCPLAVFEAKRASTDATLAEVQGQHYAEDFGAAFVLRSNAMSRSESMFRRLRSWGISLRRDQSSAARVRHPNSSQLWKFPYAT